MLSEAKHLDAHVGRGFGGEILRFAQNDILRLCFLPAEEGHTRGVGVQGW